MPLFTGGTTVDNGGGRSGPRKGLNLGQFISDIAPAIPIVGGVASNIIAGINERKARLYNSPANQIKRMHEAGLPTAAGSSIQAGGGVSTKVSSFGTEGLNDNLGKSITRNIDRKKLQIHGEELRSAEAAADLAKGNARNQLNPRGIFEGTNQGLGAMQQIGQQAEALKNAQIVNQYMPLEKNLNLQSGTQAMRLTVQNIRNAATANQIQLEDLNIKKILANYQERMSLNQLAGLIKENAGKDFRNTGLDYDNQIKRVAYTIELSTMAARIEIAKNQALASGQALEAGKLSLMLTNMSLPSTQAYYQIRRGMDDATKAKPNLANTLLYLGMFTPTQSNYNLGQMMPSYKGGNTYNQHTHFKTE